MAINAEKTKLFTTVKDGKKIGISLWEIMACLGYYKRDTNGQRNLGMIIKNAKINKWAFDKPIRHSSVNPLTDEQRASVHCGMQPRAVTKLLEQSVGSAQHQHTYDDCLAEIDEWTYLRPRGIVAGEYTERFRILDFNGYNHLAVAPDNGWGQMDISSEKLTELRQVEVDEIATGEYATYNFKLEPKLNGNLYNDGLYSKFSMRFGLGSGQGIHIENNMDIPINYIVSLEGNWRISLAVWLPNFGSYGGWGIFASRMTIGQYFKENPSGAGDSFRNLYPDLATNQFALRVMSEYVTAQGGYATFNVVPLLVRDLGNSKTDNGEFMLSPVQGVTTAYCMPSGAQSVPFICGTPPIVIYGVVSYNRSGSSQTASIENTDTETHTFGYRYTMAYMGNITSQGEDEVTLAGGEKRIVRGYNNGSGYSLNVKIISQDGVAI